MQIIASIYNEDMIPKDMKASKTAKMMTVQVNKKATRRTAFVANTPQLQHATSAKKRGGELAPNNDGPLQIQN